LEFLFCGGQPNILAVRFLLLDYAYPKQAAAFCCCLPFCFLPFYSFNQFLLWKKNFSIKLEQGGLCPRLPERAVDWQGA
jgi:hypothetical protein